VLHDRFASLGLPGVQVDGNDPAGLLAAAEQAYAGARSHRPAFLEVPVSRWAVHVGPAFEGPVDAWWQEPDRAAERCPLAAAACALLAADRITLDGLRDLRDRLNSEVEAAFVRAERGTPPPPSTLGDVCAGGLHSPLPTAGSGSVAPTDQPHREQPPLVNPF
jgi:TPP-dependent pyruvate/acetoin dehydrogenase alpha subunit